MHKLIYIFILFFVFSCIGHNVENNQEVDNKPYSAENNEVDVILLHTSFFHNELVENGKLYARRKSELQFTSGGMLKKIFVHNGDFVREGTLLASLEKEELQQNVEMARIRLDNAKIELQDLFIGMGFGRSDTLLIPKERLETARVQSGYATAELELKDALLKLKNADLTAPFSGVIANLSCNEFEYLSSGAVFCTLIDCSAFEVRFPALETELEALSPGKEIRVEPFAMKEKNYKGHITHINPMVDEHGLISVRAEVDGSGALMDGMNVRVYIETRVPDQLVVPRSAVVLRDNQEVLFKYTSGMAYWTYIKILHENSTSYAVMANPDKAAVLSPGDTVIISGNLNLAHESPVSIEMINP